MTAVTFETLGLGVRVTWESPALNPPLEALVSCYAPNTGEVELDYQLSVGRACELRKNQESVCRSHELADLPPAFELDLHREALERSSRAGWVLHAAAAVEEGRAIVLYGPSGTGKSTLVHGLAVQGAKYVTDEWALFHANGEVAGIARPITLDGESPACALAPGWSAFRYRVRAPDGILVESLLVSPPVAGLSHVPSRVVALVHLTSERHSRAALEPMRPEAALAACFESTLYGGAAAASIALRVLGRTPILRLVAGPVAENCRLLQRLWTDL